MCISQNKTKNKVFTATPPQTKQPFFKTITHNIHHHLVTFKLLTIFYKQMSLS